MDAAELRDKSSDDLKSELLALYTEQFKLRMQKATKGTPAKANYLRQVRRDIARVKTILREKANKS